jgi:hypothetical protein
VAQRVVGGDFAVVDLGDEEWAQPVGTPGAVGRDGGVERAAGDLDLGETVAHGVTEAVGQSAADVADRPGR